MDLSIVVISKNEELVIDKCIKSILNACKKLFNVEDYEIILVDSMSTDKTVDISREILKVAEIKYWTIIKYRSNKHTAALGREIGRNHAHGKNILFLDGDMVLYTSFLKNIFNNMQMFENNVAGVVGNRIDAYYKQSNIVKLKEFKRNIKKDYSTTHPGGGLFLNLNNTDSTSYNIEQKSREEEAFAKKLLAKGKQIKYIEDNMYLHLNYKHSERGFRKKLEMIKDVNFSYVIAFKRHINEYGVLSLLKNYSKYLSYYIFLPALLLISSLVSTIYKSWITLLIIMLAFFAFLLKEKMQTFNLFFFLKGIMIRDASSIDYDVVEINGSYDIK
ncbi:glycosyltransferase [Halobacillus yeomjeoni]|uniref:glycosyltransferase family 2 protein n=1 Tax=Halobacillus yeomjeoni TaxID=311194 RepID=UPI001CD61849|nr:glycosyltransferase family 2 protein [Halobacillus yeomjeoni]MCA0985181.1 glycosyltransferase [Halobacillus yeomjeoni]